ncbi:polyketide synthase dehydratase domain-containing protein, partial [Streptomyces albulus]|nr:polyketide synthase dehydratase domain-containing protein [Streptomyces noursei]
MLPEHGGVQLQVRVGAPDRAGRRTSASSPGPRTASTCTWSQHATGALTTGAGAPTRPSTPPPGRPPAPNPSTSPALYARLADLGFAYGPAFQGLRAAWRRGTEVYAEVALPDDAGTDPTDFGLHPALLDAAQHAAAYVDLGALSRGGLPFAWQARLARRRRRPHRPRQDRPGRRRHRHHRRLRHHRRHRAVRGRPGLPRGPHPNPRRHRHRPPRLPLPRRVDPAHHPTHHRPDHRRRPRRGPDTLAVPLRAAGLHTTTHPDLSTLATADAPVPDLVVTTLTTDHGAPVPAATHATTAAVLDLA